MVQVKKPASMDAFAQSLMMLTLSGSQPGFPALQKDMHTVQQQTQSSALAAAIG